MRRVFLMIMALACLIFPAYADDVRTVDISSQTSVSMDESYLRVTWPLDGEQQVMVIVTDARGTPQYQRDYGVCSGTFRSEDIYLRLDGGETTYQVTVRAGDTSRSLNVRRVMPRLTGNEACSVGYPLSRLTGARTWQSATILDIAELEGSSLTVPLHASGAYAIGTVTFSVSGGKLKVTAEIDRGVDGSIDSSKVYVATSALEAEKLGDRKFTGIKARLNDRIDLGGTPYAAVLVQMTVSFNPSGVPGSPETLMDGQEELWELMQDTTANEAVG